MSTDFNNAQSGGQMSNDFTKSPGWLDWYPNPSRPKFVLPAGTVDSHCHVFGPGEQFPFAPERKYTPCDAGKDELFKLRDHLGVSRNVIVQATCHGSNNEAMLDAVQSAGDLARGIATVTPEISDAELMRLDAAGVRGVRFNFLKRLVNTAPKDALATIAKKIAPLGWHIVIYFEGADLEELEPFFSSLPTTLVVDHLGRPDVSQSVDGSEFSRFMGFVERNDVWVKVSCPERLTLTGSPALNGESHPYSDVVPFARKVIDEFPDAVLWGTDWPHPNLRGHMPDDGLLVDFIPHIATTEQAQHKLLVANPMRLYWPGEDA